MQKLRAGARAWLRQGGASRDWIVSVLIERPAEAANREGAYTPRVRSFLAILQGMERVRKASIGVPRCTPVFREIVLVARCRLSKLEAGQPTRGAV